MQSHHTVENPSRLATYGTLAPGRVNHHQLSSLNGVWHVGYVRGKLVEDGWGAALGFPALVIDASGDLIKLHVFESCDLADHWERLDAFEGDGYQRVSVSVVIDGKKVETEIYVLADRESGLETS